MSDVIIKDFSSLYELVEEAGLPATRFMDRSSDRESICKSGLRNWTFGLDLAGSIKLATYGWPKGTEKIREARDKIYGILAPRIKHQEIEYALDGGSFVDVGRFCSGEPECFGVFHDVEKIQNRPLKIIINTRTDVTTNGQEIQNRGAAIVAAVDVLEQCGYSCEVISVSPSKPLDSRRRDGVYLTRTILKQPGEVVDLDSFAFALTHPSFLRRITFAVEEREEESVRNQFGFKHGYGYGAPIEFMSEHEERDLYFGTLRAGDQSWKNIQTSANAIMGMLEKYGLISEDESER